jgi:hypothetical protein
MHWLLFSAAYPVPLGEVVLADLAAAAHVLEVARGRRIDTPGREFGVRNRNTYRFRPEDPIPASGGRVFSKPR